MSPTAAGDTAPRTPPPNDAVSPSPVVDESRARPRATLWQRASTAVAEAHRGAVPF